LADQGKACSSAKSVVFMQRSEMKKILGKFKKSFLLTFLLKKVRRTLTFTKKIYDQIQSKKLGQINFCISQK
jgi:hypothetical protein